MKPVAFGESIWASMPVPAFLLDPGDVISEVNPAAEQFLNASARSLRGQPVFDKLMIDAPLDDAFRRVRSDQASLSINNLKLPEWLHLQKLASIALEDFISIFIRNIEFFDNLDGFPDISRTFLGIKGTIRSKQNIIGPKKVQAAFGS